MFIPQSLTKFILQICLIYYHVKSMNFYFTLRPFYFTLYWFPGSYFSLKFNLTLREILWHSKKKMFVLAFHKLSYLLQHYIYSHTYTSVVWFKITKYAFHLEKWSYPEVYCNHGMICFAEVKSTNIYLKLVKQVKHKLYRAFKCDTPYTNIH
jgi:hypothetical protein